MDNVYIVGKGPSLLSHQWQGDETAVCVNQSVYHVPNPFAAIAIDYDVLDEYIKRPPPCLIMRKSSHTGYKFPIMWLWDMPKLSSHATAVIATQLLYNHGVRSISYVGFDAIDGVLDYANGLSGKVENLDAISRELLSIVDRLNITAIWRHRA